MFEAWLSEQRTQDKADGVSFRALATDPQQLTEYIRGHLDELYAALDSAGQMVPPSAMDARLQRSQWENGRDGFLGHLTQVVEATAHLLLAVGCRGEELEGRYRQALVPSQEPSQGPAAEELLSRPAESVSEKVTTFVVRTLKERTDASSVNTGLMGKLIPVRDMAIPKPDGDTPVPAS